MKSSSLYGQSGAGAYFGKSVSVLDGMAMMRTIEVSGAPLSSKPVGIQDSISIGIGTVAVMLPSYDQGSSSTSMETPEW